MVEVVTVSLQSPYFKTWFNICKASRYTSTFVYVEEGAWERTRPCIIACPSAARACKWVVNFFTTIGCNPSPAADSAARLQEGHNEISTVAYKQKFLPAQICPWLGAFENDPPHLVIIKSSSWEAGLNSARQKWARASNRWPMIFNCSPFRV